MGRVARAKRRRRRLGMALSGGGARGAFQAGVLERLLADPRFSDGPVVLSGTSAGAINSALIAAGRSPREILRFWFSIAEDPPATASPRFFRTALESLVRLGGRELREGLWNTERWRHLLQRAGRHFPPTPASLLALLVEYLLAVRFELVSDFLEGIREPFLADTAALRDRLVAALGGETVPCRGIDLAINTVDVHTGEVVRFVTRSTPLVHPPEYHVVDAITVDMVLASCSIPLLFPPVAIGSHLLWDGGLLVNTPLAPVVALGADEIVTVLVTEPPDRDPGPLPHFGRAVERAVDSFLENAYNVDRKLLLERNRLAGLDVGAYRQVTLYEAVRPSREGTFNAGSYLYFERNVLSAMYRAGRRAADQWLAAGPRIDELNPISPVVAA